MKLTLSLYVYNTQLKLTSQQEGVICKTTQCTKTKNSGGELRKYLHNHKITVLIVPTAMRVSERSDRAYKATQNPARCFKALTSREGDKGSNADPKKHKLTRISWVCFISYLRFRPSFRLNCLKNHDDCPHSHPWMFSCASSPRGPALVRFPPVLSLLGQRLTGRGHQLERGGVGVCTRGCAQNLVSCLLTKPIETRMHNMHIMRFQNAIQLGSSKGFGTRPIDRLQYIHGKCWESYLTWRSWMLLDTLDIIYLFIMQSSSHFIRGLG